jgi:hypothetical protein
VTSKIKKVDLHTSAKSVLDIVEDRGYKYERFASDGAIGKEPDYEIIGLNSKAVMLFLRQQHHTMPLNANYRIYDSKTGDLVMERLAGIMFSNRDLWAANYLESNDHGLN